MGATLSRGPTVLRGWLLSYLQTTVAALVTQARTDWALSAFQLPAPVRYDVYDLPLSDQFPSIGAYFQNEVNFNHRDHNDRMEEEFWVQHQGTVSVWVQSPYADAQGTSLEADPRTSCLRVRDDLTELVKQALLLKPSIGHAGDCWLEESSIAVNKGEAMRARDNNPIWLAGATIPVVYNLRAELVRVAAGYANTINVIEKKLT